MLHATLLKDAVESELQWFGPEPPEEGEWAQAHELIAPRAMESLRTRMEHVFTRIYSRGLKDGYVQGVERECEARVKNIASDERERARTLKYGTVLSEAQKNRLNRNAPPFVPDSEGDAPGPGWFNGDWPAKAFAYQEREGTLLLQFTAEVEEASMLAAAPIEDTSAPVESTTRQFDRERFEKYEDALKTIAAKLSIFRKGGIASECGEAAYEALYGPR